jgi:hypothetical protein
MLRINTCTDACTVIVSADSILICRPRADSRASPGHMPHLNARRARPREKDIVEKGPALLEKSKSLSDLVSPPASTPPRATRVGPGRARPGLRRTSFDFRVWPARPPLRPPSVPSARPHTVKKSSHRPRTPERRARGTQTRHTHKLTQSGDTVDPPRCVPQVGLRTENGLPPPLLGGSPVSQLAVQHPERELISQPQLSNLSLP